ncbi:hypothetical protein MIND_00897400 [Mycena indigotica]|uniref:Uncharacterized protein n=1 Tax=Mycena indigotica TaxID=2126181 RepID=A0A8H6VZ39_9AGAR|nr:uncharacterized protein MIND_00897400 [Mycena indigotica]KAF7299474.1 hypothetical protein MIND_00897400 [Mycena indigotica]
MSGRWSSFTPTSYKIRRAFLFLIILSVVFLLLVSHPTTRTRGYKLLGVSIAPSYNQLRRKVERLPQHNLDLPFPEGKNGRYVKFSVQANFLGWNNCLNERLMNAHLAYVSNRAYVFADYWWAPEHYPFPPAPESGARTPMSALLAGPVVGGSWHPSHPSGPNPPRAISEAWWGTVCPPSSRRLINVEDVKPSIPGGVDHASGQLIFDTWNKILLEATENCIEVVHTSLQIEPFPQIFDLRIWGGQRVLELWEVFSTSPVSTLLRPSEIVASAVEGNLRRGVFHGKTGWGRPAVSNDPFKRMLAIHLRRGDYIEHCRFLASSGSGHYGWSQLPMLPDVANHRLPSPNDPHREEKAFVMCLPNVDETLLRAQQVKQDWGRKNLDILYLLTNESGEFLDNLVAALRHNGWPTVVTTHDLWLNNEQLDVGMAVDMEIAKRAAVFLGNGWSSFTSNVVHQRLVDGKDPMSIRML